MQIQHLSDIFIKPSHFRNYFIFSSIYTPSMQLSILLRSLKFPVFFISLTEVKIVTPYTFLQLSSLNLTAFHQFWA